MRLPVTLVDILLAIREEQLVAKAIPHAESRCRPISETIDIGTIPVDVSRGISQLERRSDVDPV